jgi:hypothetical protein
MFRLYHFFSHKKKKLRRKNTMWRLKIAEGGKDPYIFSTNNFVGRQTWEFDPEAGTPEERAQVEEARQNFYNNRFHVKPSSDLLWRMQVFPSSLSL